ncbi:MAG TPA: CotH kinase family protein, partial [Polyangiaceae bacterium]|nr:CotH kinase family protein [Polyangiaceae bacterium]
MHQPGEPTIKPVFLLAGLVKTAHEFGKFARLCGLSGCLVAAGACSSNTDSGTVPSFVRGGTSGVGGRTAQVGGSQQGGASGAGNGGASTLTQTGGASGATVGSGGATQPPYVEPSETLDLNAVPSSVPTVRLDVDPAAIATLEQNPFDAADVTGTFTDSSGVRYEGIQVNYRGAYQLQNLIRGEGSQRNWKLKFAKAQMYRARREWNFNYEPHIRQELAYDLMRFAGLKVPSARHVVLMVNGQRSGLFLEYEDPDNKDFLQDKFADDSGDLYKASTDIPGQTPYFGTTEYLGDQDSAYLQRYQKKTNNDKAPEDYAVLRAFLQGLNSTPESELEAWVTQHFDAQKFVRYLAVDNFISGWDGMPQRPKNYWLYEVRAAGRWVFIPWDMDATFQVRTTRLNPMGTNASIFYQLDAFESYQLSMNEGQERPLVRRLLKIPAIRTAYLQAYKTALTTYLEKTYLLNRISRLQALVEAQASADELMELQDARSDMQQF